MFRIAAFAFHRTGYAEFNMGNAYQFWNQKRYSNVSLYDRPIIGIAIMSRQCLTDSYDQCLPLRRRRVLTIVVNNLDEHKQIFDLQVLANTPDPKLFVRNMTKLSHHFMRPSCFIQLATTSRSRSGDVLFYCYLMILLLALLIIIQ